MGLLGRVAGSASRRIFSSAVAEAKYPTLLHVDAFTKAAFSGNPAAVCLLDDKAEEKWMLNVARNQNLSETAFVRPTCSAQLEGDAGAPAKGETFELRWFTPSVEVDLCGHATLAAAHALFSRPHGRESDVLRFATRSGELQAVQRAEGLIELDFPASPPTPLRQSVGPSPEEVAAALRLPVEVIEVVGASDDLLVVVPDAAIVRAVTPDLGLISRLPYRGVIVTAAAGSQHPYHFSSRFFAPAVGIAEDSVTGSAHCTLAPYWGAVLGKRIMRAVQLSERSGDMELELDGPLDTDDTAGGQPGDAAGGGAAAGSTCAAEPVSPAAKSALPSEAPAQDSSMSRVQNSLAAVTAAAVAAVGSRGRVRIRGHAVTTMEGRLLVFPPRPQPVVSRFC
mmetsp:Transcript_20762/g.65156  ORF Transcript_20762/g.65156 Transcript_20762/m.65156 type:complete len:394 (+) Transcript_20762:56-1237(+)